jgi:phenylalanyl-tRNA synthetase beta chain
LVVDSSITVEAVTKAISEGAGPLLESVVLFDRYDKLGDGKVSYAFTLTFRAPDRTLNNEEVAPMRDSAVKLAATKCGAQLRA